MIKELESFGLGIDPLVNFKKWYKEASMFEDNAEAMTLSTIDFKLNRPYSRTVLFKGFFENNPIFYTNYNSVKGEHFEKNNEASLLFYWHKSIKQVRIQGKVEKAPLEISKKYFHSRDRDSQLASFISDQSTIIDSKESLIKKLEAANLKYENLEVPHPPHWGGYIVRPYEYEFFVYGKNRLNDRFLFVLKDNNWEINRLQP